MPKDHIKGIKLPQNVHNLNSFKNLPLIDMKSLVYKNTMVSMRYLYSAWSNLRFTGNDFNSLLVSLIMFNVQNTLYLIKKVSLS